MRDTGELTWYNSCGKMRQNSQSTRSCNDDGVTWYWFPGYHTIYDTCYGDIHPNVHIIKRILRHENS